MRFKRQMTDDIDEEEPVIFMVLKCKELICQNGGECVRRNYAFSGEIESCHCADGWDGPHCEYVYDPNRHDGPIADFSRATDLYPTTTTTAPTSSGPSVHFVQPGAPSEVYDTISYSALSFFLCMALITILVAVYAYRRISRQMADESSMWWEKSLDSSDPKSPNQSFYLQRSGASRGIRHGPDDSFVSDVVSRVPESFFRKQSMLQQDRLLSSANRSMVARTSIADRSRESNAPPNLDDERTLSTAHEKSDLERIPPFQLPNTKL